MERLRSKLKKLQWWMLAPFYEEERLQEGWKTADLQSPYRCLDFTLSIPTPDTITIFKPDDLGDLICALPAIQKLKDYFSTSRIQIVVQSRLEELAIRTRLFDEVIPTETRKTRFHYRRLLKALDVQSDLAIFLRGYPDYFKDFLKIKAPIKIHPSDPRLPSSSIYQKRISLWGDRRKHQILQLLEIVGIATAKTYSWEDVDFPMFDFSGISLKLPEKFLILHPFASVETRRYPYWQDFIEKLDQEFQLPIFSIGGTQDYHQLKGVTPLSLPLVESAYAISKATAFLGNLSGPAHLAAALGKPTLVIASGQSLPEEWAPAGNTLVLKMDTHCSPCHLSVCKEYQLACLSQLTPDLIWNQVKVFLQKAHV